jgi:hypothetical protein
MILRNKTQDIAESIKKGEYEHHNVSIDASIQAPIGILPSDIFEINSTYLRIDLGEINAKSQLRKYIKNHNYHLDT